MLLKFLLIFTLTNFVTSETDYCDADALYCSAGVHIGCQFKDRPQPYDFIAEACEKWEDVELFNFAPEQRDKMIEEHNEKRNEAAFGRAIENATATRMCSMQWNEELAKTASFNVLSCLDDHDKCRNTEEYAMVGQNLYNWCAKEVPDFTVLEKSVEKWYAERTLTEFEEVSARQASHPANGHFTQLIWWNACYVGCSGARWNKGNRICGYIVCNYNFGNMIGDEIFHLGETASECQTGPNEKFPGLCSADEVFEIPPKPVWKEGDASSESLEYPGSHSGEIVHVHIHKSH